MHFKTVVVAAIAWFALALAASAASSPITYQAVVHLTSEESIEVTADEKRRVGIAAFRGIAIFADGELADYRYEGTYDFRSGAGTFNGYAIWRFEDGSEIRATYSGEAVISGAGIKFSGSHQIDGGSGRFAKADGTGKFTGRRIDAFEEGGDTYWSGTLALTSP